jgi:hypothetical protein
LAFETGNEELLVQTKPHLVQVSRSTVRSNGADTATAAKIGGPSCGSISLMVMLPPSNPIRPGRGSPLRPVAASGWLAVREYRAQVWCGPRGRGGSRFRPRHPRRADRPGRR